MTTMFAVTAIDKENHLETRLRTRPAHLQFWDDNAAAMVLAGPFLDADGKATGSLMIVKAQDQAAAEALVAQDPYAEAGLFESVVVRPWNWVINRPETI
ncbi:YciI family protein [Pelagibacterium sp.]|uniref:YciI family protein n=1 Tax=Pelagibacterium sp. TaxID=1967288 RepID=UPI003A910701